MRNQRFNSWFLYLYICKPVSPEFHCSPWLSVFSIHLPGGSGQAFSSWNPSPYCTVQWPPPKRHCRRQSVCLSALCIFAIASCACDVRQTTKDVGRWTKDAFSIRDSVSTIQHPAFTIHHSKLWHCVWRRGLLIFMTLHPVLCCAVCVCPYPSGQRTTRIHKQNADSTGCAWPGELVGGRRQLIRLPKPILTLLAVAFN